MPPRVRQLVPTSSDGSVTILPTSDGFDFKVDGDGGGGGGGGGSGGVALTQKGPFKFTFADHDALVAGVDLWTAALGDSPQYVVISVPTTGFDGGITAAPDSAPSSVPLEVDTGVNDAFVFTGDAGGGTPETFTIAPGTYSTLDDIAAAVQAATGTSSDTFGDYVFVSTTDGGGLFFTMKAGGAAGIGNTITEGNGGSAAIGVANPPATFAAGPVNLGIYIDDQLLAGQTNPLDVSVPDAAGSYAPLKSATGPIAVPGDAGFVYIGPDLAGLPYVAKWTLDPGEQTQGEVYVYALIFAELVQTS